MEVKKVNKNCLMCKGSGFVTYHDFVDKKSGECYCPDCEEFFKLKSL